MSSLYKRATPRQAVVLRMVEGAVRNAAHAHPGRTFDDEHMARSIAKRAAGTLIAGWPSVLAASQVRSEGSGGQLESRSATRSRVPLRSIPGAVGGTFSHDRRGASQLTWRAPVRLLHRAIGNECGHAKKAGDTERHAALVDVLRLIACILESDGMPDPRSKWMVGSAPPAIDPPEHDNE